MRVEPTIIFNDEEHALLHEAGIAWGVLLTESERVVNESDAEATRLAKLAGFVHRAYGMHRGASWNGRQVSEVLQGLDALHTICKQQLALPDTHWFTNEKGEVPASTPLVLDPKLAIQVIRESRERQRGNALMAMDVLQEARRVIHEAQQTGTDGVYRVWPLGWSEPGWKVMGMEGMAGGPYKSQDEAEYAMWSEPV